MGEVHARDSKSGMGIRVAILETQQFSEDIPEINTKNKSILICVGVQNLNCDNLPVISFSLLVSSYGNQHRYAEAKGFFFITH